MRFHRLISKGIDPYSRITFQERKASDTAGGATVTAPAHWSQMAVDILAGKYMRKAGVPSAVVRDANAGDKNALPDFLLPSQAAPGATFGGETDARQVFDRMAGFWTYWAWELGYFGPTQIPYQEWTRNDYRNAARASNTWVAARESATAFYDELRYMLAMQMAAGASPQWFNAGLNWAYGISGDDCGQWAIDLSTGAAAGGLYVSVPGEHVVKSPDPYKRPALSACFIQSVRDNLVEKGGIQDLMRREALVFKYGGGSGTNWSRVRGKGEPLSGGGQSSGLMSFLEAPDKSAGAIKSGGTTRRAARMLCLDDDHPELIEFVTWKATEEKKVAAMAAGSELVRREVRMVYDAARDYAAAPNDDAHQRTIECAKRLKRRVNQARGMGVPKSLLDAARIAGKAGAPCPVVPPMAADFEGIGYSTVQGQNANNSVRVSNGFLTAAERGEPWNLYGRIDKAKPFKTIIASEALDTMAYAAWECGCPGWQYDTTINEWWTCARTARVEASNPCSEYMAAPDTACNLSSLNLLSFVRADGTFDVVAFQHAVEIWTTVLDITVTAAAYPSEEIAEGSRNFRTLGLGHTNIGAFLMRRGIPYDSAAGRAWAGYLTALMHYTAGIRSARMACELAPFPKYAENAPDVLRVMKNHANFGSSTGTVEKYDGLTFRPVPLCASPGIDKVDDAVKRAVYDAADALVVFVDRLGLRNAQLTLLAPNGTIGLVMDCDTTGVEPDFALVKFKKLAGGGHMKIVNQSIPHALKVLGYTDEDAEQVRLWVVGHGAFSDFFAKVMGNEIPAPVVDRANAAVVGAMKLADCFAPWIIGDEEYQRVGVDPKRGGAAYLAAVGCSEEADWFRAAAHHACGRGTVEGCPVLKPEHLPVFDCANKCGKDGTRYLSVDAHLDMMAAVQPVLSGAISKTVNYPADATPADFRAGAVRSWKLGLKAMAAYRDGSKMSQPLNTDSDDGDLTDAEPMQAVAPRPAFKSERNKLPNKCRGERTKFTIQSGQGKAKFYLRTGEYPDGRLGEIFVDCAKEGATLRGVMNLFAMAVSIGLQRGVPLEEFVEAFTFSKFEPNGPIIGHGRLKRCDSVVDAMFRELAITYLKRDDLAHVQPEEVNGYAAADRDAVRSIAQGFGLSPKLIGEVSTGNYAAAVVATTDAVGGRDRGYTGNRCPNPRCRAFALVRAGACEKCDNCGEQSGCA